jgi:5'(3')-deoxyribonucleotidase
MRIEKIFGDLDGVYVNFVDAAGDLCAGRRGDDLLKKWVPGDYSIHPALGLTTEDDMWEMINRLGARFWMELALYPWADALMQLLESVAPVTILSSPGAHYSSWEGKVRFIQGTPLLASRDFLLMRAAQKHLIARPGYLLVDDRDDNVRQWREAGGQAIVFPRHWNSLHEHKDAPIKYVAKELVKLQLASELTGVGA